MDLNCEIEGTVNGSNVMMEVDLLAQPNGCVERQISLGCLYCQLREEWVGPGRMEKDWVSETLHSVRIIRDTVQKAS